MENLGIKKGYFLLNNKKHLTCTGVNLIGRNKEAAVIIKDTSISQHHALLVILDDGKHYLSDFNSSNGTFLGSVKLQPLRLYEITQGASVQFAEIKSTYFKMTHDAEVDTQESELSQVVDDNLYKARTQILDHSYTKLLNDNSDVLNAASTSVDVCKSPPVNHINEDANESEVQQKQTSHMDDHGYHKKNQEVDIHDLPTPVKSTNINSSIMGTIHDLPTQILDKFDNVETQGSNLSIHDLPTQKIDLPDLSEISDPKDVRDEDLLKQKVVTASTSKKSNEADEFVKNKNPEPTHDEPPAINESVLETKCNNTDDVIDETLHDNLQEEQNPPDVDENSTDSIDFITMQSATQRFTDSTLPLDSDTQSKMHTSKRNKKIKYVIESDDESDIETDRVLETIKAGPVLEDSDSETDVEIDISKEGKVDESKKKSPSNEVTDKKKSDVDNEMDFDSGSMLIKTNRAIRNVIDSSDDTDVENEMSKIKVNDVKIDSEKSDRVIKSIKAGTVIDGSDEETDVEIDISKEGKADEAKEKSLSNEVIDDDKKSADVRSVENEMDFDSGSKLIKTNRAIRNVIDSSDDTDVEDEMSKIRVSNSKIDSDKSDIDTNEKLSSEPVSDRRKKTKKARPVFEDSGSETDVEIDISRRIKTKKTRPVFEDSSSETDVDIDISKKVKVDEDKERSASNEVINDKKNSTDIGDVDNEMNFDSGSKLIQTNRTIRNSIDSSDDTDVEDEMSKIDISKEGKTDEKSLSNDLIHDKKSVDNKTDFDSDTQLIKINREAKRNVIDSSDDTDVEDEMSKIKLTYESPSANQKTNIGSGTKNVNNKIDIELIRGNRTNRIESFEDNEDEINKTEKQTKKVNDEESDTDTDVESDLSTGNFKAKLTNANKVEKSISGSTKEMQNNQADNEEKTKDSGQKTRKSDESHSEKKTENIKMNNVLDDSDVIPATPYSFVGEIDYDFSTQDLNYAAAKLEKANRDNPRGKGMSDTINSEEPLGDSFRLALSNSIVDVATDAAQNPKPQDLNNESSKSIDDLFLQATQKNTEDRDVPGNNAESESIFVKPTQKLDSKNDGSDDDDDIFIQPTQLAEGQKSSGVSEEIVLQPQIIITNTKLNDDSIFMEPTQKLGSVEEKLEHIFRPTQEDDNSIFLEATQKLPEKEKQDDAIFLKPALVGNVRKSKPQKTVNLNEVEDDIFMQATQVTLDENVSVQSVTTEEIEKPNVNVNKKFVVDDDIFMQATQVAPETDSDNLKLTDTDILMKSTHVVSNQLKENQQNSPTHSVESQLEVMFASQNVRLMEEENYRPENPLVNVLSFLKTQPEITDISDDERNTAQAETSNKKGNKSKTEKVVASVEAKSSKEKKKNVKTCKENTDSDDDEDAEFNKHKRTSRKNPEKTVKKQLSNNNDTEETSGIENKGIVKLKSGTKITDSDGDTNLNKPRRGSRKGPQLSNIKSETETPKKNTRSTRKAVKKVEESDIPTVLNEEDRLDELFKSIEAIESDDNLESEEQVSRRTRQSPQPVGKKTETLEDNESLRSSRRKMGKSTLAIIKEQPDLPSKLDVVLTSSENKAKESVVSTVLVQEEKLDSLLKPTKVTTEKDALVESEERVGRRTRRSPQPVGKKTETLEDDVSLTSTRRKTNKPTLATVKEQPELHSKLDTIPTSSGNKVEKSDIPTTSEKEDKLDSLLKPMKVTTEKDALVESEERVGRRTRRSPQPVGKKTETLEDNESLKSTRRKTNKSTLATVEEQPSKLAAISISSGKKVEKSDLPTTSDEEEKLDSLLKPTKVKEKDVFVKSTERVGKRTRQGQVGKKTETLEDNENLKSSRRKTDAISTPLENQQSDEEEQQLQFKKRNMKVIKPGDNVGEGTSSDSAKTNVKSERSRRHKVKSDLEKNEEVSKDKITKTDLINETPSRSTKRTRSNVESVQTSDSSNDFEVPVESDLPSTSKRTAKGSTDTKNPTKSKDNNEKVTEENMASDKNKINKIDVESDQKIDTKEKKKRSKRTNSITSDELEENSIRSAKKTRISPIENENPSSLENETPSTSKQTRSKRVQNSVFLEEDKLKSGADATSDDEFTPSVAKKKRKNVLDSDNDDGTSQSSTRSVPNTPTRRKLLQLQNSPLSTPERLKRKLKPKVVFTMMDSPELESLIRFLGGSVVDTIEACTVLVTVSVKRSQKLLSAVGLGKPICSPKWLEECKRAGSFLDPWDHILVDEEAENKWHFSLKESLQRSVNMKLLENYVVHLIVNSAQDVLKGAIESCGGKCVTRAPPKNSTANYLIVSTPENKSKYAKFLKQTPQPMIVAPEAMFDGVLRQELHLQQHQLT